jgi:hypothetical protein
MYLLHTCVLLVRRAAVTALFWSCVAQLSYRSNVFVSKSNDCVPTKRSICRCSFILTVSFYLEDKTDECRIVAPRYLLHFAASALEDPGMDGVKSIVLSYTFFRTGDAEVLGLADEVRKQQGYGMLAPGAAPDDGTREKIRQWAEGMAQLTGVALPDNASGSGSGSEAASASGTASLSGNGSAGTVRG